jgi:hypothetical protein
MTKIVFITQHLDRLASYPNVTQAEIDALASDILALCTPTSYASIKDVADLTGRTKGTILSWLQRGQHDCPPPLGTSSAGMIWDLDDWKRWAHQHPKLVFREMTEPDTGATADEFRL